MQAEAFESAVAVVRDALRDGVTTTKLADYVDSSVLGCELDAYRKSITQVDHLKTQLAALNGA